MALSGSVSTNVWTANTGGTRGYTLAWTATQSVENNTSTISWTLRTAGSFTGGVAERTLTATIAGTTVFNKTDRVMRSPGTVASGSIKVTHNATTGEASFSVSLQAAVYYSAVNCTGSGSFTLDTIPRATTPALSPTSVDMGGRVTISLSRASSNFTHDLAYSFNGGSYVSIATGVATSYSWTVPDLATSIPNAASGTMTIRCITKNGSTTIGTKTSTMTAKVPETVVPVINSVTVTESTSGLAPQFGAFVQGKSTLWVRIDADGAKGSNVTSYRTTFQGKTFSVANFITEVVNNAGTLSLVTTVTDSRGRTAKKTTEVTILPYAVPSTTEFSAYRCDANGNPKDDGMYVMLSFVYSVANLGGKNTASMRVEYKRAAEESYTGTVLTSTSLNASRSVLITSPTFSTDYQFTLRLTVTDWFGASSEYETTLPTAKVIFDLGADGLSFAFGKTAEIPGLEVDMPPGAESPFLVGVRDYNIEDSYGHILYNNGLQVQWGTVSITPTAVNTATSLLVVFPRRYKFRPFITAIPQNGQPHTVSCSVGIGGTSDSPLTSLTLYASRTVAQAATFRWLAIGQADMTGEVISE